MLQKIMDILLVDDAESVRKNITRLIKSEMSAVNIFEAVNCSEAERQLVVRSYDLVLLDIRLPDGSGFELMEKVRRSVPLPVVLFISNFTGENFRRKAFDLGANGFYDKTSEIDELLLRIKAMV